MTTVDYFILECIQERRMLQISEIKKNVMYLKCQSVLVIHEYNKSKIGGPQDSEDVICVLLGCES
jgi:hypothetical protein